MTDLAELVAARERWIALRDAASALFHYELAAQNIPLAGRLSAAAMEHLSPFSQRFQEAASHVKLLTRLIGEAEQRARMRTYQRARMRTYQRERVTRQPRIQAPVFIGSWPNTGTLAGAEPPWNWSWIPTGAYLPFSEMSEV